MKVGIDTNIFIKLFESEESLNNLREKGFIIYTHRKCLWEMVKYVKTLNLKDKYTERVVMDFIRRKGISLTDKEVGEKEIKDFEERCRQEGIDCHSPDSEIILAFSAEGVEQVYSKDDNFRKASEVLGMKTCKILKD